MLQKITEWCAASAATAAADVVVVVLSFTFDEYGVLLFCAFLSPLHNQIHIRVNIVDGVIESIRNSSNMVQIYI